MLTLKLALSYLWRCKLRSVLTILSIAVAVAALIAIQGLNGSIDYVSGQMAGLLGGRAQLEVRAPQAGINESYVQDVLSTEGVQTAVPFIQTMTQLKETADLVVVLGIKPQDDQQIRTYQLASGRMPQEGTKELAVPQELLRNHSLALGDSLHLQGREGLQEYKIVGILDNAGIAQANSGAVVFMPFTTAQAAFGMSAKTSYISVVLKDPNNITDVQATLRNKLNSVAEISTPDGRRGDLEKALNIITGANNLYAFIGLFLALFVIYNSMGVAVAEQKEQIGILRALGWRRRESSVLIICEALVLGILGSILGLLLGKYLAQSLLSSIAISLKEWAKINIPAIHLSVGVYLVTAVTGILASIISAYLPARKAAKVSPLVAIRKDYPQAEQGYPLWRIVVGIGIMVLTALLIAFSNNVVSQAGPGFILLGAALALPPLLVWLLQRLEPLIGGILGLSGRLGAGSFRRNPRRTVVTGMPILLGLAVSLGLLSFFHSYSETYTRWIREIFPMDIIISTGLQGNGSNLASMPESLVERVRQVDGVQVASGLRNTSVNWREKTIDLHAQDVQEWRKFARPLLVGTPREEAMDALERGGEVWISQSLALKDDLKKGQEIDLPTPVGLQKFRIAAIEQDYSSFEGAFTLSKQDYQRYWGENSLDYLYVTVKPGIAPDAVRDQLEQILQGNFRVRIQLINEFREQLLQIINGILDILNMVLIVVFLMGASGIANTLLISVLERSKEIGTLRALGMHRHQVRWMFVVEALLLLFVAFLLSLPIAVGIHFSGIYFERNVTGWIINSYFPWFQLIGFTLTMGIVTLLSAYYPAWRAARVNPVEALRSE